MEILSQREIDKLLGFVSDICDSQEYADDNNDNLKIRQYDFTHPVILHKYQKQDLSCLCSRMAENLSVLYSKYHSGRQCEIQVTSVNVLDAQEYYDSLPSPAFLYEFKYGDCIGCADISTEIVLRGFLHRRVSYNSCIRIKEFDLFDTDVCRTFVMRPMLDSFRDAMQEEVSETLPQITDIRYLGRPKECRRINIAGQGALVTMEMTLGEESAIMNLFLPKQMIDLIIRQEVLEMRQLYVIQNGESAGNAYVRLGSRAISEDMKQDIKIGSIIELNTMAGEPLDLYVDDKPFARGEAVVVDENFGLRITEFIGDK